MTCIHCHQRVRANGGRGLCRTCYDTPAVRALYPRLRPRWRGYSAQAFRNPNRPAAAPTAARPGTPEKVRMMGERAERGEGVFHPRDARADCR